jgi:hypothetical protein
MLVGCDSEASLSTTREPEGVEETHLQEGEKHLRVQEKVAKAPHSLAEVSRWNCFLDTVPARDSRDNGRYERHTRPSGSHCAQDDVLVDRAGDQQGNAGSHPVVG